MLSHILHSVLGASVAPKVSNLFTDLALFIFTVSVTLFKGKHLVKS